jgi:hypothetical protein
MNKKIKINLKCWWFDDGSLHSRMHRQFFSAEDHDSFELTSENPDFTVIFGRTNWDSIQTPKEKNIYFSQEPLFSPNEPKDTIHNYCSKAFVSDKSMYPDTPEYIETLLPMFYAGRGEFDSRPEWDWSKQIETISYEKTKAISVVVTNNYNSHFRSIENKCEVIYEKRTRLGHLLSQNQSIDIYGTFWDKNDTNIKGEAWNKHIALDEYMFSVACENSIQKNYISEKFWDVILTNGVPLYMGCNNISEYVPEDCYININAESIDDIRDSVYEVLNNSDSLYKQYLPNVLNLKQQFFKDPKYSIWERIKIELNNI